MKHPPPLGLAAAAAAALASAAPLAGQRPVPAPLSDRMPELLEQSSWAQDARYEGAHPAKRDRGVYPVGNGRVFAYMGLGARANTMQAVSGPSYQTAEETAPKGNFGELTLELLVGGERADLPRQRVRRVSGAAFVVTEDAAPGGLALRTLTFAAPGERHLTRVVDVVNEGTAPARGVVLRMTAEGPVRRHGAGLRKVYDREDRAATAVYVMTGARPPAERGAGPSLDTAIGDLAAGKRWRGVLTVATAAGKDGDGAAIARPVAIDDAESEARATLSWWRDALAGTKYFDTDHRRVKDLIEDWKVTMLVLRCAESGAVAPMVNQRFVSVRDSRGAMLALLRFNLWDEARDILRYLHDATRLLGRVPERVPLDLDFTSLEGRETDWKSVSVPSSEVPSWMILLHFWYWRVTQDTALIREHWPLLEVCLKRQRRGTDTLMTFHGGESYLGGTLYHLYPERTPTQPGFIAHDPGHGREAWSFGSGVLFLIAMQGMGGMVNGMDRELNPERWAEGTPESAPGQPYTTRTFSIMDDIEKRYWIEDERYFAPALSPVTEEPHLTPVANANLMPLWVGWTFPTGEKSRDNLRYSLAKLWRRGTRIGSTPSVGYATGHAQGMLLTALVERDAKERYQAFDELLEMAEPAGEWGELYDPEGRPVGAGDPEWPNRLQPGVAGVNLDAMLFAINGSRFVSVPNWDNTDIRLKLRLPRGATYVSMKDVRKDGRSLNIFFRETHERLSKEELEQNEELAPEQRRDPTKEHRRIRFRVEQTSENPSRGYYDVGLNVAGTVFVRYLWKEQAIDEMEFWAEEEDAFFPEGVGAPAFGSKPKEKNADADLLFLASRAAAAGFVGTDGVTLVDTGLPLRLRDLRNLLLDADGEPRHRRLFLDWAWNDPGPATFKKTRFWESPVWKDALARFAAGGGEVLEPGYAREFEVERDGRWEAIRAAGGRLALPGERAARVRTRLVSDRDREVVLRTGSGCGIRVALNGETLFAREGPRTPLPDADSELVRLREGENVVEVRLEGSGPRLLWVRVSDPRGLPVPDVR